MAQDPSVPSPLQVVLYPVLVAVVVDLPAGTIREATVLDSTIGTPAGLPAAVAIAEGDAWWPGWRVGEELLTTLASTAEVEATLDAATERVRNALVAEPVEKPSRPSLFLCNLSSSRDQAELRVARLKRLLNGRTYMNLEVIAAPAGGCFHVTVSGRAESVEELTGMVLALLAEEIASERRVEHLAGALRSLLDDPGSPAAIARARQALRDHAPESCSPHA
jgi:hypothetical protein